MKRILLIIFIMPMFLCACNNKKYVYGGKVTIEGEMVVAKDKELFLCLREVFSEQIDFMETPISSYVFVGDNVEFIKIVDYYDTTDTVYLKCVDTIIEPVHIKEVEATINEKKYYAKTDIVIKNDDDYNPMQPKFTDFCCYGGTQTLALNHIYFSLSHFGSIGNLGQITLKSINVSSDDYSIKNVYYRTGYIVDEYGQIEVEDYHNMDYKNSVGSHMVVEFDLAKKGRVNVYGNIQFVVEYNNELYKINRPICLFCL